MSDRFYSVLPFPYDGHRAVDLLQSPEWIATSFELLRGERLSHPPAAIPLRVIVDGPAMDFSLTPLGVPVVTERAASLLREVAAGDVQLVPGALDGSEERYYVVNPFTLDCLDRNRGTTARVRSPFGGSIVAPQYAVDPGRADGHDLFRLADDNAVLVMSSRLLSEIVRRRIIGPALISLDQGAEQVLPGLAERTKDEA